MTTPIPEAARDSGERDMLAVERLMGLVLNTLAVQMLLDGLRRFAATLAG